MKITKIRTEHWNLTDCYEEDGFRRTRVANIIFVDGKFDGCTYLVSHNSKYTFGDWMFLSEVAKLIEHLKEEYERIEGPKEVCLQNV